MRESVIVGGARTAFGKFGGALKSKQAVELGGIAIEGALDKAKVAPSEVDEVIMGMVLQGGAGQIPSRQAARLAGLDWSVQTETVNKVCASGMRSITLADQIIRAGDAETIVVGGMESMSNAPYVAADARWGYRLGDKKMTDLMLRDGLHCAFQHVHMGEYAERIVAEKGISRQLQDEWALRSHRRAVEAIRQGLFKDEIVPVACGAGSYADVDTDEAPRADTSTEKLAKLPSAFVQGGTVTAGNASGISDGAAALVVMSEEKAVRERYLPLASIIGHTAIAAEAPYYTITPGLVIQKLLQKTGKSLQEIDLFEVNEAFAGVVLASGSLVGWNEEKVNVNGGAIALGHPIGASGARIVLTLIHALRRRGGGLGIAAICSGGGQGDAILLRVDE
ncbi:acetyl-CoA C-acetyltransferase [Paenibacillus elgii]|uniref:acetyl-CoA C-acetyltransferase n=1 Tax=Paenibacillus elgii TaxID=189691 RepID=UPI000FD8E4B1|nr:acetyl-CoA C-acetyltransferase [Paenibacillus elgii]NEN85340.1 acetyl-CoA C-acetyltransferase [Paenibacillus elgii]